MDLRASSCKGAYAGRRGVYLKRGRGSQYPFFAVHEAHPCLGARKEGHCLRAIGGPMASISYSVLEITIVGHLLFLNGKGKDYCTLVRYVHFSQRSQRQSFVS